MDELQALHLHDKFLTVLLLWEIGLFMLTNSYCAINVNGFFNSVVSLVTNEDAYAIRLHLHVSLNASEFLIM